MLKRFARYVLRAELAAIGDELRATQAAKSKAEITAVCWKWVAEHRKAAAREAWAAERAGMDLDDFALRAAARAESA